MRTEISDFPPFYTLQPNLDTRSKQLQLWRNHILNYSKENKKFLLDYSLFTNPRINRSCNKEFIKIIIQELINSKDLYQVGNGGKVLVLNYSFKEWGEKVYSFVRESGQIGDVLTWFEIINTENQEFTGIGMYYY
jgi:ESCRT-II complex subunit VPS25